MKEIKLFKSPLLAFKLFALTLPLVAIGVWMINTRESAFERSIGWFNTLFFGLGIPIGLFHLFDRRPQITVNEIGIFDRTTNKEFINWQIIQYAYLINISGQRFISLVVDKNFKPFKRKSRFQRGISTFNQLLGAQELNINLGQINVNGDEFTDFINEMAKADLDERGRLLKRLLECGWGTPS